MRGWRWWLTSTWCCAGGSVRPGTVVEEFGAPPTLAGLERLVKKLAVYPGCRGRRADIDDLAAAGARAGRRGCSLALVSNTQLLGCVERWRAKTSPTASTPRCCGAPMSCSP